MVAIADTSYVVAIAVATDPKHALCRAVHREQQIIYLPQSTLAEVTYLITRASGNRATANFLKGLPESKYRIEALTLEDIRRTADILDQYADSRVDFVDATIATVAERLGVTRILTLDQRDFHIIRPRHAPHFEVLPQAQ